MYADDTGGLGYAVAYVRPSARFAPILHPVTRAPSLKPIIFPRLAPTPTPVLKLPNIAPPASTPAPGQPPVLILPDQPITRYDAAPAAGGPNGGTALSPNVSDALAPEVTQASLFDSSKMPLMLAILAGAWFLSRRK